MTDLTIEHVKQQIKNACAIYKKYPQPLPKMPHSCLALTSNSSSKGKPFLPTPEEIDMADTVQFIWLKWLNPDERRILWQRYEGTPLKILAYKEDLSIRQIRYKIKKSLEKILIKLQKNA